MLSRLFLLKQGKCCGQGCIMFPYTDRHSGRSTKIRKDVLNKLETWEKNEIKQFLK